MGEQKRIAAFSKVSRERFLSDASGKGRTKEELTDAYDKIKLPVRATSGSAGYDFFLPYEVTLKPGETVRIETGIHAKMNESYVLMLFPRSGLGFKYRLQLDNTVGVIDSDYFYSDNEGHIMAKITNDTKEEKTIELSAGSGFMQGVFLPYGITIDDAATEKRNGGFGSTAR